MVALHLISIGLIYLVLRNAIYSEIGCPAAVEFINSPLLYQSSSTYGTVSITRAVVSTAVPAQPKSGVEVVKNHGSKYS